MLNIQRVFQNKFFFIALLTLMSSLGVYATENLAPTVLSSPQPSPQPRVSLMPVDFKRLWQMFSSSLHTEYRALQHRQKLEYKELKASHSARRKEWLQKEQLAREQYRSENKGKNKVFKVYVQDFIARRKSFEQMLQDELNQRKQEHQARLQAMKVDHAQRTKEFQSYIAKKEVPPSELWTKPGQ